jgi:hypothetical protein
MKYGTMCIGAGIIVLIIAGAGFLLANPQVIRQLRESLRQLMNSAVKSRAELGRLKTDLQGGERVPDTAPIDEQVDDLLVGEMANIGPLKNGNPELHVSGRATIITLNNEGNAQFSPRGEEWTMWKFDRNAILIHRPEGWYWLPFDQRIALAPEAVEVFNREGKIFSGPPYGQDARSYSFKWQSHKLTMLDVGYFNVNVAGGDVGIHDGMLVKYVLAEDENDNIVFVTNNKAGTDYVYMGGTFLGESIKPYVRNMVRAV